MAKVSVYNIEGNKVGDMELNDAVFGVEVNEHLVHMAVVSQLANKRQRQGSTRAPQWTGGGIVFAPKPRDYSFKMNKKEKNLALKSVLTSKVAEDKLIVLDSISFDEIKTKKMVAVLNNLKADKALVVLNDNDKNVILSAKNIPDVKTALTNTINVYDILKYDKLIVTKDGVATIEQVYA